MSLTPRGGGFYPRSDRRRGLTVDEVADMAGRESSRSGFQRRGEEYRPNESLYSGEYRNLQPSDEREDSPSNENVFTPLAGSSRYNSGRGQSSGRQLPYNGSGYSTEFNVTAMLQEQQHILYQVLDTQKKMQQKQVEFETKLNELAQRSETSSSSPDSNGRKKCRITRDLTVSECHCGL